MQRVCQSHPHVLWHFQPALVTGGLPNRAIPSLAAPPHAWTPSALRPAHCGPWCQACGGVMMLAKPGEGLFRWEDEAGVGPAPLLQPPLPGSPSPGEQAQPLAHLLPPEHTQTHTDMHQYRDMQKCKDTETHTQTDTHIDTHRDRHTQTCTDMGTETHVHGHMQTCTDTGTDTHTGTRRHA